MRFPSTYYARSFVIQFFNALANKDNLFGSEIAQWICLHLPSSSPGFKSQAHRVRFCIYIKILYYFCIVERTRGRVRLILKNTRQSFSNLKRLITWLKLFNLLQFAALLNHCFWEVQNVKTKNRKSQNTKTGIKIWSFFFFLFWGPFPTSFFFIFVISIQLTLNEICQRLNLTTDLWYRKQPLYYLAY